MPDADDFDVDYFRKILRGDSGEEAPKPPARKAPPAANRKKSAAARPKAAGGKSKPAAGRKKSATR